MTRAKLKTVKVARTATHPEVQVVFKIGSRARAWPASEYRLWRHRYQEWSEALLRQYRQARGSKVTVDVRREQLNRNVAMLDWPKR